MPKPAIAKDQLKSFVERIECIEAAMKESSEDKREIYAEAKSAGFDVKTLRAVVRLRKQDESERQEQEAILDVYLNALGMGPLFEHREAAE